MVLFSLFELLLPGEIGRVEFSTELTSHVERKKGQSSEAYFGAQVLDIMGGYGLFTHHFEKVESALQELEIEVEPEEGTPYHNVSFNMAKMARLPGENCAAELQELREFFESFKSLFVNYPGAFPCISIQNHQDSDGHTYGTLDCGVRDATDEEEAAAKAATEEAMRRIAVSPVLSGWLQQLALDLDTIGPYSAYNLTDEHFFKFDENPVMEYLRNHPEPRKPSPRKAVSRTRKRHVPLNDWACARTASTGKKRTFIL